MPIVYIQNNTVARPPLSHLFAGPIAVEDHHDHHFDVCFGPALECVNIIRLEHAFALVHLLLLMLLNLTY